MTCVRCLVEQEAVELDRLLWCERCRERARERATDRGWWVGGGVAALLTVYIWTAIQPSDRLLGAWIGMILAAFYVASRVGREIFFGAERVRNVPAVEAAPPGEADDPGDSGDGPPQVRFRD